MEANCKQQQQQPKKPLPDNKLDVKNADSHRESSKYCLYLILDLYYEIMYASCKCFFVEKQLLGEPLQEPNCAICAAAIKVHRIKLSQSLASEFTVPATRYELYITIRLRRTTNFTDSHRHVYIYPT
jgi:hypothetical protein